MSESNKPSVVFWIILVVASLWYLMGCWAYIGSHTTTVEVMAPIYTEEGAKILMNAPAWHTAGWALAVFSGLLGCIALLLKKRWAKFLFILSLIGGIVHDIWAFTGGVFQYFTSFDKVITILSIVIPAFLIWFSMKTAAKGILR